MSRFNVANAIVCEYIALGAHGKHTIVNVYSGDITVAELPALIPVAFYIELVPDANYTTEISIQVQFGEKMIAQVQALMEFQVGKIGLLVLPQLPIQIEGRGELRVSLTQKGRKGVNVITKTIEQGIITL